MGRLGIHDSADVSHAELGNLKLSSFYAITYAIGRKKPIDDGKAWNSGKNVHLGSRDLGGLVYSQLDKK